MTRKVAKQKIVKAITDRKTLVYLVRHGETSWNAEQRFQGHLDVELSRKGISQAEALATWIADQPVHFAALFSSDLKRAVQTAQIIGRRVGLVPQLYRGLREVHGGEWQGLVRAEIEARFPGKLHLWDAQLDSFTVPGGESLPDVQERIYTTYERIVAAHPGEAIIIVSHGAALTALLAALHDWDLVATWQSRQARMGNTGVTVVAHDHDENKHDLILLNSSEHLEADGTPVQQPAGNREL
jgi:broad specificity phosphatase PhoE